MTSPVPGRSCAICSSERGGDGFSGVSSLFVVLALVLLPGAPLPAGAPAPGAWALLLGVGVTATIGQLFLTRAFAAGPPSRVSVVGLSQIVFVLVLEGLIQPRAYGVETLAGMALILAPTAYVLWRGKTLLNRMGGQPYQIRGACARGEAAPEPPAAE